MMSGSSSLTCATLAPGCHGARVTGMPKYEYATVPLIVHATKQILDQWGEDGWELVLVVPEVVPPVAAYVPAVLDGSRVYVSGQVPIVDGVIAESGHVGEGPGLVTPERAKELAAICALNAIAAIRSVVWDLDRVERV